VECKLPEAIKKDTARTTIAVLVHSVGLKVVHMALSKDLLSELCFMTRTIRGIHHKLGKRAVQYRAVGHPVSWREALWLSFDELKPFVPTVIGALVIVLTVMVAARKLSERVTYKEVR
jgi:hypothetical protein